MEDFDTEFRIMLVKVTDRISAVELNKLRFIFSGQIKRDDGNNDAIDFLRQLLDRNIIDRENTSRLVSALNNVGCYSAVQILRDYQLPALTVTVHGLLSEELFDDNQDDKLSIWDFPQETDGRPFDAQQVSLLDGNWNTASKLTLHDKTNRKKGLLKPLMLLIGVLTYTVILMVTSLYLIPRLEHETKALSLDNMPLHNRAKPCQPSLSERYFIKSRYSDKLIGVINSTNEQGDKLYQWADRQNQLCNHQWYFVPAANQGKDRTYIIQSVYNRKVFDIPGGNAYNQNRVQQWEIAMNNDNQRFRLIDVPNEDSCFIQNIKTDKVLDAGTGEFITQADLEITEQGSTVDRGQTSWQLIPFDTDRPGEKLTDCPFVSSVSDLTVIKFGEVFGSDDGHLTDDSKKFGLTISHYISSISIVSTEWINAIEFIYSSSNPLSAEPPKSGFLRGSRGIYSASYRNETFNVTGENANERIDRVSMIVSTGRDYPKVSARYIVGIQFHTTFNRTSPFYGSREGQSCTEEYPGFVVGYVRGAAYMHIERLQFVWYKL